MNAHEYQIVFAGASLLCASLGSIHDVREGRIPNRVTFSAMAAGLALHTFAGGWPGLGDAALAGLLAGTVCLIFHRAGGMGGGDVKLMAAVGCLAGLSSLPMVGIATAIAGGVFALALSFRRGRLRKTLRNVGSLLKHHGRLGLQPHPELNLSNANALRLPFALPVAAGCLFAVCVLVWEAHS